MISIDNAVELMIKTFLGLPSRVTGIKLGREKFREISESFPKLLDALEEHAADRLVGIELGDVEWYHRLRNQLYHEGNGLTVVRDKVDVYAELARLLFKNLFGFDIGVTENKEMDLLGSFIVEWAKIERDIAEIVRRKGLSRKSRGMIPLMENTRNLHENGIIDSKTVNDLEWLRQLRNRLVHGAGDQKNDLTPKTLDDVRRISKDFDDILKDLPPEAGDPRGA
jgi:hypothetical protein